VQVDFLDGESEEQVLEYFGGPPASAKTIVKNGDPEGRLGISVPGETVRTGSLMKAFVQIGVLVRELNLQVIDFGQGSCLVSLSMPTRIRPGGISSLFEQNHGFHPYHVALNYAFHAPELIVFNKPSSGNPYGVDLWTAACAVRR
jgi:hypothetical protein